MDIWNDIVDSDDEIKIQDFQTDYEKAEYLQQILINHCTNGGETSDDHYKYLRKYFLAKEETKDKVPSWVRTNRNLSQFWQFIKSKISNYSGRRKFIWNEFNILLEYLESVQDLPYVQTVDEKLKIFNSEYIISNWKKALDRKNSDPEGAITIARTLLESVLKHILDNRKISYSRKMDLHELYKLVADEFNLSPNEYNEKLFKQILGGCSAIVSGLGNLRNDLGDAHGKGKTTYRPADRHAELAVNLSGTMCLFLVETYDINKHYPRIYKE
ncbi:abortive infection family protein [Clostridium botulinum]|uniref:abortive infection family protein n=1 Tax=Clostridium botulinum TaxID=1491 RepID=UPI00339D5747